MKKDPAMGSNMGPTARTASADVTVNVMGKGGDAREVARVGDWELTRFVGRGDDEPRVRDLDLAERLGYERPRKIRELVRELADENFNPLAIRPQRGQTPGRPSTEYWLSEEEALYVTSQSKTDAARKLTRQMVRVFMLARRGLLAQQQTIPSQLAEAIVRLVEVQNTIVARLEAVETRVTAVSETVEARTYLNGLFGKRGRRELLDAIQSVADLYFDRKAEARGWRSKRKALEMVVRDSAGQLGAFDYMPAAKAPLAWTAVGKLRGAAEADAAARGAIARASASAAEAARQMSLLDRIK